MEIAERAAGDVTILDVTGKMTLGEGDEILKDKVHSLALQGRKKIVLNLAGVPYIDSAGLGEIVRGQPQAAGADQTDHRSAVHHETADGLRNLRQRSRRRPELRFFR
jgi:anti-anti-sigma factor